MDPLSRDLLGASPSLRRLVLALVRDEHLADDLVQEAWLAALRRRHRPPEDPGGWALAFVRKLLRGVRRREGRRREQEALAPEPTAPEAPDELLAHQSFLQIVARTAEELDEPYRTVIRLRYWEELSPPEIAARLGRPHDTVKTQLRRGLEILRERLDRQHDGDRKAWVAPLRISLERLASSPAPRGLPVGALLTAATVPLIAWLGWTFLRDPPREPITATGQPTIARAEDFAPLPPPAEGSRVAAPAEAAPELPAPPEETSPRIAVTVVDDLGRPVVEAAVFVLAREAGFRFRGRTDSSGALQLTVEESEIGAGVYPGKESFFPDLEERVVLCAKKAGHASSLEFLVRCPPGSAGSVRLDLRGPELIIEGLVTDAAGSRIPGAEAQFMGDEWLTDGDVLIRESVSWERADASGSFTFTGLEAGVRQIAVHAPGWVSSLLTLDGSAAGVVECAAVLAKAGSIAGIVRDGHGKPIPGARVTHDHMDFDVKRNETRAGPGGHYQVGGLPPGRHLLWAQDPESSGLMSRAWVEVGEGTIATWDPVLEPVDGIKLRVVDEHGVGLAGWSVRFEDSVRGPRRWFRYFETGLDGRVLVFDLPDRAVQVTVRRNMYEAFQRAGRAGLKPAADEVTLVVSRSDPAGSIAGVVLTDQGAPPSDAQAWLLSSAVWEMADAAIDPSSGEFAFSRIPDGSYELMVQWGRHGRLDLERVELADGEQIDRGLIRMPATGRAVIDWSWPARADYGLLFSIAVKTAGGTLLVMKGPAPPPAYLDLLPGSYYLIAEGDAVLQQSPFQVESGRKVLVASGPRPEQR